MAYFIAENILISTSEKCSGKVTKYITKIRIKNEENIRNQRRPHQNKTVKSATLKGENNAAFLFSEKSTDVNSHESKSNTKTFCSTEPPSVKEESNVVEDFSSNTEQANSVSDDASASYFSKQDITSTNEPSNNSTEPSSEQQNNQKDIDISSKEQEKGNEQTAEDITGSSEIKTSNVISSPQDHLQAYNSHNLDSLHATKHALGKFSDQINESKNKKYNKTGGIENVLTILEHEKKVAERSFNRFKDDRESESQNKKEELLKCPPKEKEFISEELIQLHERLETNEMNIRHDRLSHLKKADNSTSLQGKDMTAFLSSKKFIAVEWHEGKNNIKTFCSTEHSSIKEERKVAKAFSSNTEQVNSVSDEVLTFYFSKQDITSTNEPSNKSTEPSSEQQNNQNDIQYIPTIIHSKQEKDTEPTTEDITGSSELETSNVISSPQDHRQACYSHNLDNLHATKHALGKFSDQISESKKQQEKKVAERSFNRFKDDRVSESQNKNEELLKCPSKEKEFITEELIQLHERLETNEMNIRHDRLSNSHNLESLHVTKHALGKFSDQISKSKHKKYNKTGGIENVLTRLGHRTFVQVAERSFNHFKNNRESVSQKKRKA